MKRIAWLTDVHLNFVEAELRPELYDVWQAVEADAFWISGDIGEANSVVHLLREMDATLQRPIYFVLGNHDFYFGSIRDVRERVTELCRTSSRLVYLTRSEIQPLSPETALLGHDGWADGRIGDYERSYVMMNDYRLIAELAGCSKAERWPRLMALADEAAAHLGDLLRRALAQFRHVYLMTHVPPWRQACWYQGQPSDDEWAPHFTSQAVGHSIEAVMADFPDRRVTVLCGHTHSPGTAQIAPNIEVWTGAAEYGHARVERVIEVT